MPSTTSPGSSASPEPASPFRDGEVSERVRLVLERLGLPEAAAEAVLPALVHRSFCAEHAGWSSNERLEFLGDAVLGLVVADRIFADYPDLNEGDLAKLRAAVVSSTSLAEVASEVGLGRAILLGKGEEASGGREKPSILADGLEAVLGAVYRWGGLEEAARLVDRLLGGRIAEAAVGPGGQDYKTRLQELVAQRGNDVPVYELDEDGPDHAKRFFANVRVAGALLGRGEGRSKKQAEQEAAREAWSLLVDAELERHA
jgi:ribonuclease-3